MKKREATFTTYFKHYLKANEITGSAAFEIKQTANDSLPFVLFKEHQLNALLAAQSAKGLTYKIPDDSMGYKPFDLFHLKDAFAFVVIKFPGQFHIIGIDTFLKERAESKRKSLTNKRAEEIAVRSVTINLKVGDNKMPSSLEEEHSADGKVVY